MSSGNRELYNSVKWQNELIDVENAKMRDQYSTGVQRSKYLLGDIEGWKYFNTLLWFGYYIIIVYVCYLLYNLTGVYSDKKKVYIGLGFILFPFLITTIEIFIHYLFGIVNGLITMKPYPKETTAPSLSLLDALPPLYA